MSLKITVKSEERIEDKITLDDIKPGMVFEYGDGGPTSLKLRNGKVVLLTYSTGHNWFDLSDESMNYRNIKILGRLDEIIVVKE